MVRVTKSKHMPGHLQGQKELSSTDVEVAVADPNAKPQNIESGENIRFFKQLKQLMKHNENLSSSDIKYSRGIEGS